MKYISRDRICFFVCLILFFAVSVYADEMTDAEMVEEMVKYEVNLKIRFNSIHAYEVSRVIKEALRNYKEACKLDISVTKADEVTLIIDHDNTDSQWSLDVTN